MATILLSDEEYKDISELLKAATNKIAAASPRAATHYKMIAKIHANFLAQEDGKRAIRAQKQALFTEIEQQTQARRADALQRAQERIHGATTPQPPTPPVQPTGRKEKSA